jgi:RimJ/RimL family protein N-acetyltransferase
VPQAGRLQTVPGAAKVDEAALQSVIQGSPMAAIPEQIQHPTIVIETERLVLRRLAESDAAFILELVNEPAWLEHIGDKGVGTLEDARSYIVNGPVAMYERFGFGLYLVARKSDAVPLGICGLVRRDTLPDVDLGFALLSRFWGNGYAQEAAASVMAYAGGALGLARIVAITALGNHNSKKLLETIGFVFERLIKLADDRPEVRLFAYRPRPARGRWPASPA